MIISQRISGVRLNTIEASPAGDVQLPSSSWLAPWIHHNSQKPPHGWSWFSGLPLHILQQMKGNLITLGYVKSWVFDWDGKGAVLIHCNSSTTRNAPAVDVILLDNPFIWFNEVARASVSILTLYLNTFKRMDICFMIDHIKDVLHSFQYVGVQQKSNFKCCPNITSLTTAIFDLSHCCSHLDQALFLTTCGKVKIFESIWQKNCCVRTAGCVSHFRSARYSGCVRLLGCPVSQGYIWMSFIFKKKN